MSFLRLLSTGKSLVGMREEPRPYQVPDEPVLPRFERKKNPFRATTRPAHKVETPIAAAQPTPAPAMPAANPEPVIVEKRVEAQASGPEKLRTASVEPRKFQLWAWIRSFVGAGREPQVPRAPQQTELRLEKIQVVRNDLSESDIEIVPRAAGPQPGAQAPVPVRVVSPEAVSASSWGRVSARVFGGKSN